MSDDHAIDERFRYTTRLQRRARARVTAELGAGERDHGVDQQVAVLLGNIQEAVRARRVTLFRVVPQLDRWSMVSLVEDAGFSYGLVAPETMVLPMVVFHSHRTLLLGPGRTHEIPPPRVNDPDWRSYLGLPLLSANEAIGVLEVVDLERPEALDDHERTVRSMIAPLLEALRGDVADRLDASRWLDATDDGIDGETVLDLVLRPPVEPEATIQIDGEVWPLLYALNGERSLLEAAAAANLPPVRARVIAAELRNRGLLRMGREARRR